MKTGFLIINYNDVESTKTLIDNIKNYSVIDEIVVVDNKSTDDSFKELKKLKLKNLKVICSKENKGYSSAINLGCKELIKDLETCNIFVSNADIIIDKEEDLKKLLNTISKKDIGVVAPTILERGNLNRGWKNISPLMESMLNLPYIHRLIRKKYVLYKEEYYKGNTSKVDIVSGCFFLMNSETLEEIDYLDENVFLYYEENILASKIHKINKQIIVDNKVTVIHNHSVTIDKNLNKIKKYKMQKKSQYYFEKNYNNANKLELVLLKVTAFMTKLILYVYYYILDLLRN